MSLRCLPDVVLMFLMSVGCLAGVFPFLPDVFLMSLCLMSSDVFLISFRCHADVLLMSLRCGSDDFPMHRGDSDVSLISRGVFDVFLFL